MNKKVINVPKTWRSEIKRLLIFAVLCVVSYYLTQYFPGSIITGSLFSLFGYTLYLSLPLFWFMPLLAAGNAFFRVYNVRFLIDNRGIKSQTGILALRQRITRIRFEDIRSIETEQSILDRMLNIGDVEIGTAATGGIEIVFQGVAAPLEVQIMIQTERDHRQKIAFGRKKKKVKQHSQQAEA